MEKINYSPNKIVAVLLASQSLTSASIIMIATVGSIHLVALAGGNKQWTGVTATTMLIGEALIAYPASRLMDVIGRRLGLSLGHALGVIGACMVVMAILNRSIPLFLAGAVVFGLARGTLDLGRYAAADASPPSRRARAIALVVLGGTIGSITGPTLINVAQALTTSLSVVDTIGPWMMMGIFFLLGFIMLLLLLRPDPRDIARQYITEHTKQQGAERPARPWGALLRDPAIQLAACGLIFSQLAMITVMTITPVDMAGHDHSLADVSWVIMAHTLGMFGFSFFTGWLADKIGRASVILVGGLTLTIACLIAPFATTMLWLAVSLFLLGLGWNLSFVASSTLLDEALQIQEKGRGRGAVDSLVKISSGVGSLGSGLLFAATGFALTSWLTVIAACVPIALALITLTRQKTAASPTAAR